MMNVQFSLIFARSVGSFLIPTYISNYHSINFASHYGVLLSSLRHIMSLIKKRKKKNRLRHFSEVAITEVGIFLL